MSGDRLFVKTTIFFGPFCTLPAGECLSLKRGSRWPSPVEAAIEDGRIIRLAKEQTFPLGARVSEVGDDNFADWFKEPQPYQPPPRVKLYARDIMKRFEWSSEQWELAKKFGFPSSAGRAITMFGGYDDGREFWIESDVMAWADQIRGLASSMRERV